MARQISVAAFYILCCIPMRTKEAAIVVQIDANILKKNRNIQLKNKTYVKNFVANNFKVKMIIDSVSQLPAELLFLQLHY